MKENNFHPYSDISSFKDFHLEKEKLLLKRKIIETRIDLGFFYLRKAFSLSNLIFSVVKEYVLPKN